MRKQYIRHVFFNDNIEIFLIPSLLNLDSQTKKNLWYSNTELIHFLNERERELKRNYIDNISSEQYFLEKHQFKLCLSLLFCPFYLFYYIKSFF